MPKARILYCMVNEKTNRKGFMKRFVISWIKITVYFNLFKLIFISIAF